ncbi:hypothetical protein [Brevibacillus reuszeri]|nr:hypothetical protein [Brevibacillus reuszeri]KNB73667.1 hypothetical protein ADS79_06930 [Brevibacillus reuszeri]MED1858524.1 hypothetical protein [Brevibacillus reuszeri]
MKKQKWMMMGATAIVCSALLVPGAFAKSKDDVDAPPVFFSNGQATHAKLGVDTTPNPTVTTPAGTSFLFPATAEGKKDK